MIVGRDNGLRDPASGVVEDRLGVVKSRFALEYLFTLRFMAVDTAELDRKFLLAIGRQSISGGGLLRAVAGVGFVSIIVYPASELTMMMHWKGCMGCREVH